MDTINQINEKEQRIKTKEAEQEWAVIQKIIVHLHRNGFSIKNTDGSKLNMRTLNELHEQQFNETKKTGTKAPIYLTVIDADHQDGYIQFTAGNGFLSVITGYSCHLTCHINLINRYVYSSELI